MKSRQDKRLSFRGKTATALPREPVLMLALLLAVNSLYEVYLAGARRPGIDFFQYWVGAKAVKESWCDNIYSTEAGRRSVDTVSARLDHFK